MNLFTALLIGIVTGAAGFILFRYFDHNPPKSKSTFISPARRWVEVRYQLLLPVLILTIFSSLLWLRWVPIKTWGIIVFLYVMGVLLLPWLKGNFRFLAILLCSVEILLATVVIAQPSPHPAGSYYLLLLLHLLFPITAVAIFFALFVRRLIPMPPAMDKVTEDKYHQQTEALFSAFFCGMPKPIIAVQDGQLITRNEGNAFLGTGPGLVMTDPEYTVLIRDGSRVRRVIGPGVIFTENGDVADYVFDLRWQIRSTRVNARTRDGIELEVPLSSIFHIQCGRGKCDPQLDRPWPYRPSAIIKLYFARLVDPDGKTPLDAHEAQPWQDLPLKEGVPILQQIISRYELNDIYAEPRGQPIPNEKELLRVQIGAQVREEIKELMKDKGIQITGGAIGGAIKPLDPSIFKQKLKVWQAQWADTTLKEETMTSLAQMKIIKTARSGIALELITNLKQLIKDHQYSPQASSVLLSLRLIELLEDMANQPTTYDILPKGTFETLSELHARLMGNISNDE